MKKILATLLAICLVLVNVAAMAEQPPIPAPTGVATAEQTVTIKKAYKVEGNGAEVPAHTIEFAVTGTVSSITALDVADSTSALIGQPSSTATVAPELKIGANKDNKLTVGKGETEVDLILNLPSYSVVGIYEYTINEVATSNNAAGITYIDASKQYTLRVTVIQEGDALKIGGIALREAGAAKDQKTDEIENLYEAGTLTVSKTVSGNMGDQTATWHFTVTFTKPSTVEVLGDIYFTKTTAAAASGDETPAVETPTEEGTPAEEGTTEEEDTPADTTKAVAVAAADWSDNKATYEFTLIHGESIKFENIPEDVQFAVVETEDGADGYTTTKTGDSGAIANHNDNTAAFENNKGIVPDTGIELETLPFVLLMVVAMAGVVTLSVRRRQDY